MSHGLGVVNMYPSMRRRSAEDEVTSEDLGIYSKDVRSRGVEDDIWNGWEEGIVDGYMEAFDDGLFDEFEEEGEEI